MILQMCNTIYKIMIARPNGLVGRTSSQLKTKQQKDENWN